MGRYRVPPTRRAEGGSRRTLGETNAPFGANATGWKIAPVNPANFILSREKIFLCRTGSLHSTLSIGGSRNVAIHFTQKDWGAEKGAKADDFYIGMIEANDREYDYVVYFYFIKRYCLYI